MVDGEDDKEKLGTSKFVDADGKDDQANGS